jgi:hypothetical protein
LRTAAGKAPRRLTTQTRASADFSHHDALDRRPRGHIYPDPKTSFKSLISSSPQSDAEMSADASDRDTLYVLVTGANG